MRLTRGKAAVAVLVVVVSMVAGLFLGLAVPKRVVVPASTTPPVNQVHAPGSHEVYSGYGSPDRRTGPVSDFEPDGVVDAPGGGMRGYLDQQVEWSACGKNECARVLAPLDYADPDRAAITIAMLRVPSKTGDLGPLFVNPGGPGGSGMSMAASIPPDTFPGHDVVGWDPRGVGGSTPVSCGDPKATDDYLALDTSPDDEAEYQALVEGARRFALACRSASGVLLDHVSTIENVRDLDLMRELIGKDRLDYLGVSYGTYVGAMYAELFPDHVGHLVLDSAVDITDDETLIQASGFDSSLRAFAEWAAERGGLGDTPEAVEQRVADMVDGLDEAPLTVGGRQLTQSLAAFGVATYLYSDEQAYPALMEAVQQAIGGDGRTLLAAADAMNDRDENGEYGSLAHAFPATSCVDWPDKGLERARQQWRKDIEIAPRFATWFGPSVTCEVWTAAPVDPIVLRGRGAPPILVIGSTGDSATPYRQAVAMADQLESAVLLTREGAGHGSLGDRCVSEAVRKYLASDALPEEGAVCG